MSFDIDIRTLTLKKNLKVLEITFFHEFTKDRTVQHKILEILNDDELLAIFTSMETRTYIVSEDVARRILEIADDTVKIEVMSLQELIREFEEDEYTVESDYYAKRLKPNVYRL